MNWTHGGIVCAAVFVGACSFTLDFEEGAACNGSNVCAEGLVCRLGSCQPSGTPTCGDFMVDAGEVCDDGNDVAGDGCNATCTSTETCGNGFVDTGEACDDGNTIDTDACVACEAARCGDGFVYEGVESCDDGDTGNGAGNNQCLSDCSGVQRCGDGATEGTEVCDDGDALDGGDGSCTADCLAVQSCGNNVVEGTETCDDGNMDSTDACIACVTARCGDGFVQAGVEVCDDGALNGTGNGFCAFDCSAVRVCGDGVLAPGEVCDDGAVVGEGSCINDCSGFQICGNGIAEGNEACDDGFTDACGTCNADCTGAGLGPGMCGDGVACPEFEFCDDGFTDACGTCNANCTAAGSGPGVCGDGQHCPEFEACDDGFTDSCGTCNADCSNPGTGPGACGDGAICPEFEACDDGSGNGLISTEETCQTNCLAFQRCGDSEVQGTEFCDDGPGEGEGLCTDDCLRFQYCGDGEIIGSEHCDDGNLSETPSDMCNATCTNASDYTVSTTPNGNPVPRAKVAVLEDDSFVVAFSGPGDVFFEQFSASTVPARAETIAHTTTTNKQARPYVAALSTGGFLIVWEDNRDDPAEFNVFARRFLADGTPADDEFRVNDSVGAGIPRTHGLRDGGFIVVWDQSPNEIRFRRFDTQGAPVGNEATANSTSANNVSLPSVGSADDGSFVIAWTHRETPVDEYFVRYRLFSPGGTPVGPDTRATTQTAERENHVSLSVAGTGDFVLSWDSSSGLGTNDVISQRFSPTGEPIGEALVAVADALNTQWTATAWLNSGGFVVGWGEDGADGDGFGVRLREYDENGIGVAGAFTVNQDVAGDQKVAGVAAFGQGALVVWDGEANESVIARYVLLGD